MDLRSELIRPDAKSIEWLSLLPDEARLWIYGANRELSDDEVGIIQSAIDEFMAAWSSHGRDVLGEAVVIDSRFLAIGAHIPSGDISGCGIDKSSRVVAELSERLNVEWLSALHIFYRDESDQIGCASRSAFRKMARSGTVDGDTLVYDLTIPDVGKLRDGQFLRPATSTWHGNVFGLDA